MSKEALTLALGYMDGTLVTDHLTGYERKRHVMNALREALAEHFLDAGNMVEQPQQEPFGYFRAEPFGWTDCAETDDGAVALYENPPAQRTPLTIREIGAVCGNFSDETIKVVRQTELANGIGLKVKT